MKQLAIICIIHLLPLAIFSQETSELVIVKWTEEEEKSEKSEEPKKPGRHEIGDFFYNFSVDKLVIGITKYNSDAKVVEKAKVPIKHNIFEGKVYYTGYEKIDGRYWITTKIKDKANLKFHFIIQELDLENLRWVDQPKEFVSINFLRFGYWEKVIFKQNEDADVFMVSYHDAVVNEENQVTEFIHIAKLYSKEWELLDEVKATQAKTNSRKFVNHFRLTESNKILGYQIANSPDFFDEDEVFDKTSTSSFKLLTPKLGTEFEKLLILETLKYVDPFVGYTAFEKDNVITVMGLYNDEEGVTSQGIAFKNIDYNNNKKETQTLNEFDPVERVPEEPLYDPNLLSFINGSFYQTDNGYFFITHKMTQRKGKYKYPNGAIQVGLYTVMEGIYIFYYDKTGNEMWKKKIPYLQYFPAGRTSSSNEFGAFLRDDNLYLVYDGYNPQDDSEKDLKLNKMLFSKKRILMCGIIRPDGEIHTDPIFKDAESKFNTNFYFDKLLEDRPGYKIRYYVRSNPKYGFMYFKDL